jgi:hypothetical protein
MVDMIHMANRVTHMAATRVMALMTDTAAMEAAMEDMIPTVDTAVTIPTATVSITKRKMVKAA